MAEGPERGAAHASTRSPGTPNSAITTSYPRCAPTSSPRLGHTVEARAEYLRAASLTENAQERAVLLRRADAFPATG